MNVGGQPERDPGIRFRQVLQEHVHERFLAGAEFDAIEQVALPQAEFLVDETAVHEDGGLVAQEIPDGDREVHVQEVFRPDRVAEKEFEQSIMRCWKAPGGGSGFAVGFVLHGTWFRRENR